MEKGVMYLDLERKRANIKGTTLQIAGGLGTGTLHLAPANGGGGALVRLASYQVVQVPSAEFDRLSGGGQRHS